jgi:hypothetical protein
MSHATIVQKCRLWSGHIRRKIEYILMLFINGDRGEKTGEGRDLRMECEE